ncbi:MAG: DUF2946 family protein, partial [Caulobacterales bacterium]
ATGAAKPSPMIRGQSKFAWRQALTAIALLALCVRALIPGGYMLGGQSADGQSVLVTLCSAQGPMQIAIDLDSGAVHQTKDDVDHSGKTDAHAPCVFAAMAALAAPALGPAPIDLEFAALTIPARAEYVRPGLGLAAPPPPATGPPLNA